MFCLSINAREGAGGIDRRRFIASQASPVSACAEMEYARQRGKPAPEHEPAKNRVRFLRTYRDCFQSTTTAAHPFRMRRRGRCAQGGRGGDAESVPAGTVELSVSRFRDARPSAPCRRGSSVASFPFRKAGVFETAFQISIANSEAELAALDGRLGPGVRRRARRARWPMANGATARIE